ncbi:MAG: dihydromonapterin reductase [Pseudomonadota bacterium]
MERSDAPIVITGGAQRLGLATAVSLNKHYPVVITYRKERPVLDKLRAEGIETIRADFGSVDGAIEFASELRRRFSSLRALIHNASEWMPESEQQSNAAVMQSMLNVHVMAPYLINQECGELLFRYGQAHGYADIVHLTDFVANSGSKKHIAYAASKAALENMTLSFARKLAPQVKVNSIAPALLMFNQDDQPQYRQKAAKKSLLQAAPGEIEGVSAINYILESRYLTGKTISLDGGRHLANAS